MKVNGSVLPLRPYPLNGTLPLTCYRENLPRDRFSGSIFTTTGGEEGRRSRGGGGSLAGCFGMGGWMDGWMNERNWSRAGMGEKRSVRCTPLEMRNIYGLGSEPTLVLRVECFHFYLLGSLRFSSNSILNVVVGTLVSIYNKFADRIIPVDDDCFRFIINTIELVSERDWN